MNPANNAPVYIGAYKELAEIARKHGYAMAVHGSVARDLDLVCIPWIEDAAEPQVVVDEITAKFAFKEIDKPASTREHGRIVFTLAVSFGDCFIDLSFTPKVPTPVPTPDGAVEALRWIDVDAECAWTYAKTSRGEYRVTWSFGESGQRLHFPDGHSVLYSDRQSAKAAAEIDFAAALSHQAATNPDHVENAGKALSETRKVVSADAEQIVAWRWKDDDDQWQATCDEYKASFEFRVNGREIHDLVTRPALSHPAKDTSHD